MSQISPPLRILLAGSVLFLAAWFVMLRPGGAEVESDAPPVTGAQTAPGQAVEQAEEAAGAAAQPTTGEAVPETPATVDPATATGTAPAVAVKGRAALVDAGLPSDVAGQIDKKVVVLAFVNPDAADDRRVAGSMEKVYLHGNKVWTKTANIKRVSKYAAITRGAEVQQSPTVLVVDRHRAVTALVGYVDSVSINQAVVDALLVDGRPIADSPYLQKLEGACGDLNREIRKLREPRNLKQLRAYVAELRDISNRFGPRVRGAKPPKRYRGLHRQVVDILSAGERLFDQVERFVKTGQLPAASVNSEIRSLNRKSRRLDLRLAGLGMEDCR